MTVSNLSLALYSVRDFRNKLGTLELSRNKVQSSWRKWNLAAFNITMFLDVVCIANRSLYRFS